MKRIGRRAVSVLLIALMIVAGMGLYSYKYYKEGASWALYYSTSNSGSTGSIVDRNGAVLARFDSENRYYSDDAETRIACYHITGDYWGRTGSGLLSLYGDSFSDYSIITGTTQSGPVALTLTIDAELNKAAYRAIGSRDGAALLINYRTGEILAAVSAPSTDPLDSDAVLREGTFINKCFNATFIPGSVFKLITAAAAIETIDPFSRNYYCEGSCEIAGIEINCSGTHYNQNFTEALANSCNVAFAQIAVKVGQTEMLKHVREYGFLSSHKLGRITTAKGNYLTEFSGDPELAWSGIGQSVDLVSPYAMLRFVAAIANGGTLVEPSLVKSDSPAASTRLIDSGTASELARLMKNAVQWNYSPDSNFPGLSICAKTGTAELGDGTSHSWFVGFLNDEIHPYAFVVIIERGGGGLQAAGSVANQLLQQAVRR